MIYGDMATGQLLLCNANPTGYAFKGNRTLNVIGGILADSVRVALSTKWADHVFEKDYQLQPLPELEEYIKSFGHLPGIPKQKEVETNGIDLAAMNTKLLEKVEELTLHIIALEKLVKQHGLKLESLAASQ
jgi:hypothetical protein